MKVTAIPALPASCSTGGTESWRIFDSTSVDAGGLQHLTSWISGWCQRVRRQTTWSRSPRTKGEACVDKAILPHDGGYPNLPALIKIAANPDLPRGTRSILFWVGSCRWRSSPSNPNSIAATYVDRMESSSCFCLSVLATKAFHRSSPLRGPTSIRRSERRRSSGWVSRVTSGRSICSRSS